MWNRKRADANSSREANWYIDIEISHLNPWHFYEVFHLPSALCVYSLLQLFYFKNTVNIIYYTLWVSLYLLNTGTYMWWQIVAVSLYIFWICVSFILQIRLKTSLCSFLVAGLIFIVVYTREKGFIVIFI